MAGIRVLVTGFGPFPGIAENPSAGLAERLVDRASTAFDAEFHARILPTEWGIKNLIESLYATLQPHVMIHFGLSARAKTFRIERSAHNRTATRIDAAGVLPASALIRPAGPDRYDTALPVRRLAAHLRACGIPAIVSPSAGSYLCNFLYYQSLHWSRQQTNPCRVIFVHVPPPNVLTKEAMLLGGSETLRFMLGNAHERTTRGGSGISPRDTPGLRAREM